MSDATLKLTLQEAFKYSDTVTNRGYLADTGMTLRDMLKFDFKTSYDEKDSIGKRYRRQDAVGTPFCVTVDHDTLNDGCVTIRHRDTMEQERVKIEDLHHIIYKAVDVKNLYRKLVAADDNLA